MLFCVLGETGGRGHERTMAPNVTTHRWSCRERGRERGEGVGIRDASKFTRCRENKNNNIKKMADLFGAGLIERELEGEDI